MPWFSILSGALKLAGLIAGYLKDRQLMDAGAQREVSKMLGEITHRAGIADQVRAEIAGMSDNDLDAELRGE